MFLVIFKNKHLVDLRI